MTRLKDQVPALKLVGSAADLRTALEDKPRAVPAAFVLKEERSASAAGGSNGVLVQMCSVTVQVVLFVRNASGEARGVGAREAMDALIASVRAALLKWSPDNSRFFHGLSHLASRDESYSGGWLVAQEIFQTRYPIEVRP
ncbi:hypothetical protein OS176_09570 [Xanthomonadaceae bacterium XH05]|nr:hypothetical protein [Xanthomonadaceae bacterium XH05]